MSEDPRLSIEGTLHSSLNLPVKQHNCTCFGRERY
jgi:hypothetical protein